MGKGEPAGVSTGLGARPELEGCLNFRDLGGYLTTEGHRVRRGCLFRSGELCSLTDGDRAVIGELGIRVVVDLRNDAERTARPNRLSPGIEMVARTTPGLGDTTTLEDLIASGDLPERDDQWVISSYCNNLTRLAPEFRAVVERAATARSIPMLFHCAAGKDRTGLAAAILLGLLGVPEEAILYDYELTTSHYSPRRLEQLRPLLDRHKLTPERIRHLVEARPVGMEAALALIRDRWDGFEGYAGEVLGLADELPSVLRHELLVA